MFLCPKCDNPSTVTATRAEIRRRKCLTCTHTFYTEELEYDGVMQFERRGRTRTKRTPGVCINPKHNKILQLFNAGATYAEVGRAMGIPRNTVARTLNLLRNNGV